MYNAGEFITVTVYRSGDRIIRRHGSEADANLYAGVVMSPSGSGDSYGVLEILVCRVNAVYGVK